MGFFTGRPRYDVIVYIYESEYQAIISEVERFHDIETGGDLFGTFTHGGMPVIWLALGPGPHAQQDKVEFRQDTKFTTEWQRFLMQNFGIQYIGAWHSHHKLGINHPSPGDVKAVQSYAHRHRRRSAIEIIAVYEGQDISLIPYFYPDAQTGKYVEAEYRLMSGESPVRQRLGPDRRISVGRLQPSYSQAERRAQSRDIFRRSKPMDYSEEWQSLPPILQREIKTLDRDGVSVEQKKEDVFMVVVPLSQHQLLAIAVQGSQDLSVLQVNFIDQSNDTNQDITPDLRDRGIVKVGPQSNGKVLRSILSYIERERPMSFLGKA